MASARVSWSADEIMVAAELVVRHGWVDLRETHPDVIELSRLLRSLPMHAAYVDDETFRSPKSVSRKVTDLYTARPGYAGRATKGGDQTMRIAEAFWAHPEDLSAIALATRALWEQGRDASTELGAASDVDDPGASEGRTILAAHLRRERDRKLRDRKIEAVLQAHGALNCEVCDFNFGETYGEIGDRFIEVHHVVPLHASGPTVTKLTDLAVLCSNCHRMIHRRTPWLTPDELRASIRKVS